MESDFVLSQSDGRPMYLQIIDQIRLRIAVGDWEPGFKLPSIRELAVATRVSVITVKRAYHELETEGVIVTQQGKGSFVAQIDDLGLRLREEELEQHLRDAIEVARSLGLDAEEIKKRLDELMDDQTTHDKTTRTQNVR
ncbi:MAG: GntR family transcriptional regulator [Woeseiaceae bacterium]|nr:GntR family transcriptional regulator [Woeseiaceae bacterium]